MTSSTVNRAAVQRTKWETCIDLLKTRPAIVIFTFICIAAGLVLGGIFIGKVLDPTENDTPVATNSTKQVLACSDKDNYLYQKCVDDLKPFREPCEVYVGMNCSESLFCQRNCLSRYSINCPCQVCYDFDL